MSTSLVLTVIGPDRPGPARTGGISFPDTLDLRGQLAGKPYVEARRQIRRHPACGRTLGACDTLEDALRAHHARGLSVVVERGIDGADLNSRRVVGLELLGTDRPGIVHAVTEALT